MKYPMPNSIFKITRKKIKRTKDSERFSRKLKMNCRSFESEKSKSVLTAFEVINQKTL